MYKCEYFKIYELVDPITYKNYGEKCWQFFDENSLLALDRLREVFGPAIVNDWKWGGKYKYSGYRPPTCKIGAKMSMHRLFRAFDIKFKNISAKEVRKAIRKDIEYFSEHIGRIENKVNWLHIDTANAGSPLKFFNP